MKNELVQATESQRDLFSEESMGSKGGGAEKTLMMKRSQIEVRQIRTESFFKKNPHSPPLLLPKISYAFIKSNDP